ncbi:MAG: TetR/AcrR family transcriptional regulator [Bermanella sp.]|jgi:TetR/AcrR family transcriptional regulator
MITAADTSPTRRRGRPRKADAPALSIEQLLQASATIFARDGYDGVSLRKLQTELGVSYTFFHHYFDSKDALWKAVVDQLAGATTAQVLAALTRIDDSHDEFDALQEAIRIYLSSAIEHPAMQLICLQEAISGGPRLDYIYKLYFEGAWAVIADLVTKVERSGRIKPVPIESLFFAVQSALAPLLQRPFYEKLTGNRFSPAQHPAAQNPEHYIQQSIDLLFHGWCK